MKSPTFTMKISNLTNNYVILEGAIFIADAHENENRKAFLAFLNALLSGKLPMPPQLFLLGDIFDFLANTTYTNYFYKEYIEKLNTLSKKTEIFYFEGNHDFNLEKIFPNINVFPIQAQPVNFKYKNQNISIAHGDIFLGLVDTVFLRLLRNKFFLKIMDFLDRILDFKITKSILNHQINKKLDYKIPNFEEKMKKRLKGSNADIIIEGHYHQGKNFNLSKNYYMNLSSFACERSYLIV